MAQLAGYFAYQHFLVTSRGPFVAHVEINRPAKLNAFLESMWLELRQLFRQLSTDADVRVVVLSGAGDRAFTAGLDVQAASQGSPLQASDDLDPGRKATMLRRYIGEFQDCITAVEKCEKRQSPALARASSCSANFRASRHLCSSRHLHWSGH